MTVVLGDTPLSDATEIVVEIILCFLIEGVKSSHLFSSHAVASEEGGVEANCIHFPYKVLGGLDQ